MNDLITRKKEPVRKEKSISLSLFKDRENIRITRKGNIMNSKETKIFNFVLLKTK